jgi:hypothetical protein
MMPSSEELSTLENIVRNLDTTSKRVRYGALELCRFRARRQTRCIQAAQPLDYTGKV